MCSIALFTIGHSNHSLDQFLDLLQQHQIEALVDVRRFPSGECKPHSLTKEAKLEGETLTYPGQKTLFDL